MSAVARVIHVYYAHRAELPEAAVAARVTDEDRRGLTPTMRERRRSEYLAGRALLRHALAREIGASAASLRIELARDGKPHCVDGPAISISHSNDLIVCAVAAGSTVIGIDAEASQPRDIEAIAERFFTSAEARWIGSDPVRFRSLWVLKEAYLKALGVGISGGLDSLECRIDPPAIVARVSGGAAPQLALLAGRDCYLGIASADDAPFTISAERWAPSGAADEFGPFTQIAATA